MKNEKFRYSEKASKFEKFPTYIWGVLSNFVAFLENLNFNQACYLEENV